jgi:hypothetical protein
VETARHRRHNNSGALIHFHNAIAAGDDMKMLEPDSFNADPPRGVKVPLKIDAAL